MFVRTNPRVLVLSFAVGIGAFLRLNPVLAVDFPLMDGGLFFTLTQELRQNDYQLPVFSAYNQADIPYVYPPLSFYLAGTLADFTGWSDLDVLRILPAVLSVLTIPACYLLAHDILASPFQALLATFSFALLPTAFDFLIVGAGLPRASAFLFSLLTLWQLHRLYTRGNWQHALYTSIFAGLTVLSHPTIAWFTAYSALVFFLTWGRHRRGWLMTPLVALGTLILSAPWWVTVLSRHGIAPFLAASQLGFRSWINLVAPFLFLHTNEPYVKVQAFLGLLGIFACFQKRQYFLPAWLGLVFILEPRLAATYSVLPMVMLVATGLDEVVLRGLGSLRNSDPAVPLASEHGNPVASDQWRQNSGMIEAILLTVLLVYTLISTFIATPREALSTEHRSAMTWAQAGTPPESRFLVISGIEAPGSDMISEWFPTLSHRISLNTPQGLEWRDGKAFNRLWNRHVSLQACTSQTVACLEAWTNDQGNAFDYLYISTDPHPHDPTLLLYSLSASPDYQLVYKNSKASIYAHSAR